MPASTPSARKCTANKEDAPARQKGVLKTEILEAFRNPDFRKAFWTNILWLTAFYASSPFNTSYQIKDLSLPFTFRAVSETL